MEQKPRLGFPFLMNVLFCSGDYYPNLGGATSWWTILPSGCLAPGIPPRS